MLNVNELSEIFDVSVRTIERWIKKNYLIGTKIKNKYCVTNRDFRYFLNKHPEYNTGYLKFIEKSNSR